jgi:hypothetical protein
MRVKVDRIEVLHVGCDDVGNIGPIWAKGSIK